MPEKKNLMEISSKDFEDCVISIITRVWGSDISSEAQNLLFQKITEFLRQQNIASVTSDDINLIIISAVNKAFMNPLDYMELFITDECNLRCHHCFVRSKGSNRMTPQIASEAIDLLMLESRNNKNLEILFFGGEPLLEFELVKQVTEYAEAAAFKNGKKIHFNVTTNGTLFTEDILKFSKGRIYYLISIDGNKATHDRHRKTIGGGGSYDMVSSKIDLIKEYQPWLGTRMTVHPDTADMLMENVAYLYSIGFNQFIIGPSYGPTWDEKALAAYEDQLDKIADLYIEKTLNKEPFRMTFFEGEAGKRFCAGNIWGCRAGRNAMTVSITGELYPCSKFVGLVGADIEIFRLGDVFTGITKLDVREDFVGMKTEYFTECVDCDAADYCTGGCPANNYNDRGSVYKPSSFDCATAKVHKRVLQKFDEKIKSQEEMAGNLPTQKL